MKHVLITGGSRGIGEAMVRLFSAAGYRVSFTYHKSHERAECLATECSALALCADNESETEIQTAYTQAVSENGEIDVLINNAAISEFSLFGDISLSAWNHMMGVNLNGAFLWSKAVLPYMIREKRGNIINISSIWGITGSSCEVHYSTSKAALIGLTRALAKEVGPSGIRVNCIAPGVIDTEMNALLTSQTKQELCDETPLGRLGTPEEIAKVALFLVSDGGAFLTGQVISPNGGICI